MLVPLLQDTISAIVDAVTVNGTVHIPLAFTTTFLEDTINVTGVTLSGLDTFTEVCFKNLCALPVIQ
jgi:hypothetical protein